MRPPVAILVGFIGKLPLAGMALYNLHYAAGLRELGYDVFYVEQENAPGEYYDPVQNVMTEEVSTGLAFLQSVVGVDRVAVIDRQGRCHGAGWRAFDDAVATADFVLNVADATWIAQLERCPRRAFVDGDPLFTQVSMLSGGATAEALRHYGVLFTYAARMNRSDCTVPRVDRDWIATRPVVSTAMWRVVPTADASRLPVTTVMNWSAWSDIELDGRVYGQKGREMTRFIDLPERARQPFALAVGGPAPREELTARGWTLVNPLDVTGTLEAYRAFIDGSSADLGIAKHAYVASRSGWFSDRSLCYLASGRPVLHQDTGFNDWLPVDHGVLTFSDPESLLDALKRLERDYVQHASAARETAETHFEARTVIGRMLDDAGFR
jgi:hypothetical protein